MAGLFGGNKKLDDPRYDGFDWEATKRARTQERKAFALKAVKGMAAVAVGGTALAAFSGFDLGSSLVIGGGTALAAAFGAAVGAPLLFGTLLGLAVAYAVLSRSESPWHIAAYVVGRPVGAVLGGSAAAYFGYKALSALTLGV